MTQNWPARTTRKRDEFGKSLQLWSYLRLCHHTKELQVCHRDSRQHDSRRHGRNTAVTSWFCERTQSAACSSQMEHGDELHQPSQSSSCVVPACPAYNITDAAVKEEWTAMKLSL